MIKKVFLACLSVMLFALSLTACSSNKESSKDSTEEKEAILTIDGKKIDDDEFRYVYFYMLNYYGSQFGLSDDQLDDIDKSEKEERFSKLKDEIINLFKNNYVYFKYADENDISLTEKDKENCEEQFEEYKTEQGDNWDSFLEQNNFTEGYYKKLLEQSALVSKVQEALNAEFSVTDDEFLTIAQNELYQVKHVLIPFGYEMIPDAQTLEGLGITEDYASLENTEKINVIMSLYSALSEDEQKAEKEKAKEYAQSILDKANSGEDFDALISKYGFDAGMNTFDKGYILGDFYTSYDKGFLDASVSLDVDQISELVESVYGYHIIKRVKIDTDYIKNNIKTDEDLSDESASYTQSTFKTEYETAKQNQKLDQMMENLEVIESDEFKNLQYGDLT